MIYSLAVLEKCSNTTPMGMKSIPMTKKVGSTVRAVSTGCQAGSRCCLKAESVG